MAVKNPTVVAISGSEAFLQARAVRRALDVQRKAGWVVTYVSGTEKGALEMAIGSSGCFEENPRTLIVVTEPEKASVEMLSRYAQTGDPSVVILLDYPGDPKGNTKFGKFLDGMGKAHQNHSLNEKVWQRQEDAKRFLVQEAKEAGQVFPEALADALVARLGASNWGFLWYELQKLVALSEAEAGKEITVSQVKRALAPLAATEVTVLADVLLSRDADQLFRVLQRMRQGSKQDPTIEVCAKLGGLAQGWLELVAFRDSGKSTEEIIALTGKNAWLVTNKLLPPLKRWQTKDLVKLIKCLAWAQRQRKMGALSPWNGFCARLVAVAIGQN